MRAPGMTSQAKTASTAITGHLGWLRGAIGAALGMVLAGSLTRLTLADNPASLPWLMAPMGASAILLFMVPASPLSQPWPFLGGNMFAGIIGLVCTHLLGSGPLAAGCALGIAIAVMSLTRTLHPPAGGTALLLALAGPPLSQAGPGVLLDPLAVNLGVLVIFAAAYNSLTGHPYPHRTAPIPTPHVGYSRADLEQVLEDWDEVLDVSTDDLDALFQAVERARTRRLATAPKP